MKLYSTFEAYEDAYPLAACKVQDFVDSISGDNMWWFDKCYVNNFSPEKIHSIFFTSYCTPEYQNYMLSITGKYIDGTWLFTVHKQVTELS